MTRRSAGRIQVSRSVWYVRPGVAEIRTAPLAAPDPGSTQIRALWSGVSRGTERLVLKGLVPEHEHRRMRAPLQEGDFPFPVKYGYCAVGVVESGPEELRGRPVFCLHPHQDVFNVTADMAVPLPDGLDPRRATLAANMETALNALWDSGAGPADRIVVVGAGIVGLLVTYLAARLPGADVTVIDPLPERQGIVESFGASFSTSPPAAANADVAFHTSASAPGLATAIAATGFEGAVVELSWYGDKEIAVPLGGSFHSQRLRLVSSQVGQIATSRRARWTYRKRLEAALRLLDDPRLDVLTAEEIAFADVPAKLPALLDQRTGLAPVIRY